MALPRPLPAALFLAAACLSAAPRQEEPAKVMVVRVEGAPKRAQDVQVKVIVTGDDKELPEAARKALAEAKGGKQVRVIRVEATGTDDAAIQAEIEKALAAAGVDDCEVMVKVQRKDVEGGPEGSEGKALPRLKQLKVLRSGKGGETIDLVGPEGAGEGKHFVFMQKGEGGKGTTVISGSGPDKQAELKALKAAVAELQARIEELEKQGPAKN
ncbi:MAG: hypothetical protein NTW40_09410 [Acidobacteria bacterium]|nr:hypothetical protein [Acidobacteriota bacterium]